MADDVVVNIAFKGNASDFLAELSRSVGRAKTQLQELGQSTAQLSRLENTLARMSTQANGFAGAAGKAAQATAGWSQKWVPFKGQFMEAEAASKKLWGSIDSGIASAEKSLARGTKAAEAFQIAQAQGQYRSNSRGAMADWDAQFKALSQAADASAQKVKQAQRAIEDYQNSLSNARYVLYDVAGTFTILGAAMVVPLAGVVSVATEFEKQFAQVARTSGLAGTELGKLKTEFDELYGSIPITYESLAKIATLAGQLGVPADQIANFTEVVAKTSAVTDLSVEQAATAFGRLNALIPNVKGQYERLGSAIAKVGVNSVATESEIVNISTQISSMGSFAGLTAQDIIGLSGALASVGAQPELSRGTITRVFTVMSRAVANGGAALDRFANVSGVSAEEFRSTWGTPAFSATFLKFMDGIKQQGGGAVSTLNELGITSVRDVPLLLRLANAADSTGKAGALLAQTIGDANQGWAENIELQRQYEIIAGTVAAKTEVLVNNFNLFLQALGGPMLKSLGDVIDLLTDFTKTATDFVSSDFGGSVARTVVVLTALLGVLALAAGAMALMGASSIGVYQALLFLSAQSPVATTAILGTAGAAKLADGSLKASAASATAFSRALKALSLIGLALVLPDLLTTGGNAIADQVDKVTGATRDWSTALKRLGEETAFFGQTGFDIKSNPLANFFLTVPWDQTTRDLQFLNDELERMASVGDFSGVAKGLTEISKASGQSLEQIIGGSELEKTLGNAGVKMEQLASGYIRVKDASGGAASGGDSVSSSINRIESAAESASGALDEFKADLEGIGSTQMDAAAASDALQSSVNAAWAAMAEGGITLEGIDAASIGFRGSLREIETNARNAGLAIAENGGSVEEATAKWQTGRDEIINMLTSMLGSRDAAVAWADANLGASEDVANAMATATRAVESVPDSKTIFLYADTGPAQTAINGFITSNTGRTIMLRVMTDGGQGYSFDGGNQYARAGGGSVFGPGSSTSDSILAKLSNGEFVLRTAAAKAIGYGKLDYMNRYGKMPAFAGGGQVGNYTAPSITNQVAAPEVRVYLGNKEITQMVQVQVDNRLNQVAAKARKGGGR